MKIIKGKSKDRPFLRPAFLVLVAVFLFLVTSQDFLHHHPLENGEREDCPLFMFKRAVHFSHMLWLGIFFIILVVYGRYGLTAELPKGRVPLFAISGRAPPMVYSL